MDYFLGELMARVARSVERKIYPHRHGEFRPGISYWLGIIPIVIGLLLFIAAAVESWPMTGWLIALSLVASGVLLCVMYFRIQLHFRRYGVFIFRFGKLTDYQSYADWSRVTLAMRFVPPIEVVRKNGTNWYMPWIGDRSGAAAEMLWRIEQAGVPVPDQISRINRMGIRELDPFSLRIRGKYPRREKDEVLWQ